jgi:competence protein ComEC
MAFNEKIRQIPFLRLLLPFTGGIILQLYFPVRGSIIYSCIAVCFFILIWVFLYRRIKQNYAYRWVYGTFLHLFLFLLGAGIIHIRENRSNYTDLVEGECLGLGNLIESPQDKPRSVKSVLEIISVRVGEEWVKTRGKSLIYFQKDSMAKMLNVGDQVVFLGSVQPIQYLQNPGEFNFRRYMGFHDVYGQLYLPGGNWKVINRNKGNALILTSRKLRSYFLNTYRNYGLQGDELAVAGALTLGFRDFLGEELKEAYATSGAMHILAVSGLHVGIIYFLIFYLFYFVTKFRFGRVIRVMITMVCLWSFAFLTGLSPSVMRATTMFSFIVIGQSLHRQVNIFNILAASAFFLLLLNPYLITEIGFQLSYTAVTGIVYFQPKMYRLYRSKYWIIDKIWGLVTVSIGAQLGTFPLAIYYFNQFPNYFLLTNIMVIPFATIIIYLGVMILLFSWVPLLSKTFSFLVIQTIKGLNYSIDFIESLPYSLTTGISNTVMETIFIYFIILCVALFLIEKKRISFIAGLFLLIIFIGMNILKNYQSESQRKMVVYNVKGISTLNFIDSRVSILLGDFNLENNRERILYYVSNYWNSVGIREKEFYGLDQLNYFGSNGNTWNNTNINLFVHGNFIQFYDKRIYFLNDRSLREYTTGAKIRMDYLIYSKNPGIPLETILKYFTVEQIIIDSSNSYWYYKKVKEDCRKKNIPCYSVAERGAFILDIKSDI